jgi:hypothetical protein
MMREVRDVAPDRKERIANVCNCRIERCTVEADINSGHLEVILPQRQLERVHLHFLHAFGRIPPLRARLFMDFVAAEIAAYLA